MSDVPPPLLHIPSMIAPQTTADSAFNAIRSIYQRDDYISRASVQDILGLMPLPPLEQAQVLERVRLAGLFVAPQRFLIPPEEPQRRSKSMGDTHEEQKASVKDVLSDLEEELHLDFDWRKLVDNFFAGEAILGSGETQSGKTGLFPVAHLCAYAMGIPCVHQLCLPISNTPDFKEKYDEKLEIINDHPLLKDNNITLTSKNLAGLYHTQRADTLTRNARPILRGGMALIISFLTTQISRVGQFLQGHDAPPCIYTLDEADKHHSCNGKETARETALISDVGRSPREDRPVDKDLATVYDCISDYLPNIHSLLQISATNLDSCHWHITKKIPFKMCFIDPKLIREKGYVGCEILEPLTDVNGDKVFIDRDNFKPSNDYGWGSPEMVIFQDTIKSAHDNAQIGMLVIDICTPRVKGGPDIHTAKARAKNVSKMHNDFVVLDVNADGVWRTSYKKPTSHNHQHNYGTITISTPEAWERELVVPFKTSKRSLSQDDEHAIQWTKLKEYIETFDDQLHIPIYIIGYIMLKRSMSPRSTLRVPQFMLLGPSNGTSIAEMIQMIGRVYGRNRQVLEDSGVDSVIVLLQESDLVAIEDYYAFSDGLMTHHESLLNWATENYPLKLWSAASSVVQSRRRIANRPADMTIRSLFPTEDCIGMDPKNLCTVENERYWQQYGTEEWSGPYDPIFVLHIQSHIPNLISSLNCLETATAADIDEALRQHNHKSTSLYKQVAEDQADISDGTITGAWYASAGVNRGAGACDMGQWTTSTSKNRCAFYGIHQSGTEKVALSIMRDQPLYEKPLPSFYSYFRFIVRDNKGDGAIPTITGVEIRRRVPKTKETVLATYTASELKLRPNPEDKIPTSAMITTQPGVYQMSVDELDAMEGDTGNSTKFSRTMLHDRVREIQCQVFDLAGGRKCAFVGGTDSNRSSDMLDKNPLKISRSYHYRTIWTYNKRECMYVLRKVNLEDIRMPFVYHSFNGQRDKIKLILVEARS